MRIEYDLDDFLSKLAQIWKKQDNLPHMHKEVAELLIEQKVTHHSFRKEFADKIASETATKIRNKISQFHGVDDDQLYSWFRHIIEEWVKKEVNSFGFDEKLKKKHLDESYRVLDSIWPEMEEQVSKEQMTERDVISVLLLWWLPGNKSSTKIPKEQLAKIFAFVSLDIVVSVGLELLKEQQLANKGEARNKPLYPPSYSTDDEEDSSSTPPPSAYHQTINRPPTTVKPKENFILTVIVPEKEQELLGELRNTGRLTLNTAKLLFRKKLWVSYLKEEEWNSKNQELFQAGPPYGSTETEYDVYFVKVRLNGPDERFAKNSSFLKMSDAFTGLGQMGATVEISSRHPKESYENRGFYSV